MRRAATTGWRAGPVAAVLDRPQPATDAAGDHPNRRQERMLQACGAAAAARPFPATRRAETVIALGISSLLPCTTPSGVPGADAL